MISCHTVSVLLHKAFSKGRIHHKQSTSESTHRKSTYSSSSRSDVRDKIAEFWKLNKDDRAVVGQLACALLSLAGSLRYLMLNVDQGDAL